MGLAQQIQPHPLVNEEPTMYEQVQTSGHESFISVERTLDPVTSDGIEDLTDIELQAVSGARWAASWRSGSGNGTDEWVRC
jgi:hypothetical protein